MSLLLIDDDEISSQILGYILVDEGYKVDSAATGGVAIEKFSGCKYDLALLDYVLPDMSGRDVMKKIRAIDPHVKIILLSGYANTEEPNEDGFDRTLLKPVSPDDIVKTIKEILS